MLFNSFPVPAWTDAWGGALAFGLQVYFDFSGYTDMAVGLALLFNVRLPGELLGGNELEWLLLGLAFVMWAPNRQRILAWRWTSNHAYVLVVTALLVVCLLGIGTPTPFYYFQF